MRIFFESLPLVTVGGFLSYYFVFIRRRDLYQPTNGLISPFWRSFWLWLIKPLIHLCLVFKLRPNHLTLIGGGLSVVAFFFFAKGWLSLAAWVVVFASTFDMLDGYIAKKTRLNTKRGSFIDSVIDRFSESIIFIGLMYWYRYSWGFWIIAGLLVTSYLISYIKARALSLGYTCDFGLMQRSERVTLLCVGVILTSLVEVILGFWNYQVAAESMLLVWLVGLLLGTTYTAIERLWLVIAKIKD